MLLREEEEIIGMEAAILKGYIFEAHAARGCRSRHFGDLRNSFTDSVRVDGVDVSSSNVAMYRDVTGLSVDAARYWGGLYFADAVDGDREISCVPHRRRDGCPGPAWCDILLVTDVLVFLDIEIGVCTHKKLFMMR